MSEQPRNVDKSVAFILELVGGLMGYLGLGYMFAGKFKEGIIRLVVWLVIMIVGWVIVVALMMVLIGICFLPVLMIAQVLVPIWSAFQLKRELECYYPEQTGPMPPYYQQPPQGGYRR